MFDLQIEMKENLKLEKWVVNEGSIESAGSSFGKGNFGPLVKFRVDADVEILVSHIGKNASYISKTTQNQITECCGKVITETIVNKSKQIRVYVFHNNVLMRIQMFP